MVSKNEQNHCQQGKSSQDGATKGGKNAYHAMCPCFCDVIFLNAETGLIQADLRVSISLQS
jgi:hypothetical protein